MGLTQNHQLPFPEDTDKADIASDIYELVQRLDNVLTAVTLAQNDRIALLEEWVERFAGVPVDEALAAMAAVTVE